MSVAKVRHLWPVDSVPAESESVNPWDAASNDQRNRAADRRRLIGPILEDLERGLSQNVAVDHFLLKLKTGKHSRQLTDLAHSLGRGGKMVSRQTLKRWLKSYNENKDTGLLPQQKGSTRKHHEWEPRALHFLRMGSNNKPGHIARMLQQEGVQVTDQQVRRFIKTLPAHQVNNPGRLGALKYDSTQRGYTRRDLSAITVGTCYQSDGNLLPIYLQHPTGNRPARFEMTPVIDVRSRFLTGYHLSESESAISTLHALSDAILRHNHVPLDFQADNGPGFKNERVQRFFLNLGILESHPRPRNPKDNGYIERWHQTLKDEFLKQFPAYCGRDAAPEPLKAYLAKVDKGQASLMTLAQFSDRLDEYIRWYNVERIHGELGGTPAALWETLERREPFDLQSVIFWDQAERTVGRETVRLFNREYSAPDLIAFNGRKVLVEYNLRDDSRVKVCHPDGRWICDAPIVKAAPYRSTSVLEDQKQKSLQQKRRRLALKQDELEARAGLAITHDQVLDDLELASEHDLSLDNKKPGTDNAAPGSASGFDGRTGEVLDIDLDITRTDY